MRNRFAVIAALAAMPLATAAAQNNPPRNVLSIQPLSAVMTVFSGEYERATSRSVSFGLGATYWDAGNTGDEVTYTSGDLKLRYYPSGVALQGFSVGATAGYSNVAAKSAGVDESVSAPSFGVLIEYQWLMGTKRNFAMTLGGGAKMLTISENEVTSANFTARYPTARISIGYAF